MTSLTEIHSYPQMHVVQKQSHNTVSTSQATRAQRLISVNLTMVKLQQFLNLRLEYPPDLRKSGGNPAWELRPEYLFPQERYSGLSSQVGLPPDLRKSGGYSSLRATVSIRRKSNFTLFWPPQRALCLFLLGNTKLEYQDMIFIGRCCSITLDPPKSCSWKDSPDLRAAKRTFSWKGGLGGWGMFFRVKRIIKCKMRGHTERLFAKFVPWINFCSQGLHGVSLYFSIPGIPCGAIYLTDSRDPIPKIFVGHLPLLVAILPRNWVGCPLPLRCEDPFPPPPRNRISQRYLRNTTWLWEKDSAWPPLQFYVEEVLRNIGVSPMKALRKCISRETTSMRLTNQSDSSLLRHKCINKECGFGVLWEGVLWSCLSLNWESRTRNRHWFEPVVFMPTQARFWTCSTSLVHTDPFDIIFLGRGNRTIKRNSCECMSLD